MRTPWLLLLLPLPAWASSTGVVGMSGKVLHCGQCHNRTGSFFDEAPPEQAAIVRITAPAPLTLGSAAVLELLVESRGPAPATGPRALGFDLAVSQYGDALDEAGALAVADDARTRTLIDELTHSAPIAFDAEGKARIPFTFTPAAEGTHAFHLAVNDVDRDGLAGAGDLVTPHVVCFDVVAPSPTELACTSTLEILPPEPEPPVPVEPEAPVPVEPEPGDVGLAEVSGGPDAEGAGDTSSAVGSGAASSGGCTAAGGVAGMPALLVGLGAWWGWLLSRRRRGHAD